MATIDIALLDTAQTDFESRFDALLDRDPCKDEKVDSEVREIVADVRSRGDRALLDYTARLDDLKVESATQLEVGRERLDAALQSLEKEVRAALEKAAERIGIYHERQKVDSWSYEEDDGTLLGQQVTAIERVGLYVPGGKAVYPSSVLMNAIPAKIAGVEELIMTVPTPKGQTNDMVLAAAAIAGVDRVFTVGGAQAIAALAYGTETIPKVDKIVGPGNIYVATAKRQVYGVVDIDMIAGPSEIVVVCDGETSAEWVAMDLFSQAEHDELAQAILITPSQGFIQQVSDAMNKLLPNLEREAIIRQSLSKRGALIKVKDINEAIALVNRMAPEHLELSVEDPMTVAKQVRHAGAIFLGRYTAEALGDYCAGPNHVLPTSGTARFSSPLGVYDFQKRTSLIQCSVDAADSLGKVASVLARGEGFTAHARSAEYRVKTKS